MNRIYDTIRWAVWRLRRSCRLLLSYRSAVAYLAARATDWDIQYRDYPPVTSFGGAYYTIKCSDGIVRQFPEVYGASAHYIVRCAYFFDYGTGRGVTAMQAARRAYRHMRKRYKGAKFTAVVVLDDGNGV